MFDRAAIGYTPSTAKALRIALRASAIFFFVGCGDRQTATSPARVTPQGGARSSLAYSSFAGAPMTLRGSATVAGSDLVLTSGSSQIGAGWSSAKQRLSKYWETSFQFKIEPATCGVNSVADGFAFVLQNTAANAFAANTQGSDLGYAGFQKALAVEFDILNSGAVYFDDSDNQVAVVSGGQFTTTAKLNPLKRISPPIKLKDGALHSVKITYDKGALTIVFDNDPTTMVVPVDLANVNNNGSILDANGAGWVGFTGATGGWCAKQRITNWSFIDNRAPVAAVASASYKGDEGSPITMTATASDPDNDAIASYEWDLDGDGTVDATTTTGDLTHAFLKPGTFPVSVVAVDAAGARSVASTAQVTVDNVAPVVSAPTEMSTLVGEPLNFSASFSDPGSEGGPWSYHIDWGDGSAATDGQVDSPSSGISAAHTFAAARRTPYLVNLTVTDKATASASSQTSVRAGQVEVQVALDNLTQVYSGQPRNVSVSTNPANVSYAVTYNNASSVPVNAGEYDVLVSITDPRYVGTASGKLVVSKAPLSVHLAGMTGQVYDGSPKTVSATVDPAGVDVVVSYNDGPPPVNAGSYTVIARVEDPNYYGSESGTFVVGRGPASIQLGQLVHNYDGMYKFASASTTPAGLSTVSITYNGSTQGPAGAGSYAVVATLDNPNYVAENATGTLVINPASQTLVFGALSNHVFGDAPFTVSAQPGGSSSPVTFTLGAGSVGCSISGNLVTITGATGVGQSCTIVAHQAADANYLAAPDVARSFTIDRADVHVVWATPASIVEGTPLGGEQLNATALNAAGTPVAGSFTYSPSAGTILSVGTQLLSTTFQPSDASYRSGSATVQITVTPAPAPEPPPSSGMSFRSPLAKSSTFNVGRNIPVVFQYVNPTAQSALAKSKGNSNSKAKGKDGRPLSLAVEAVVAHIRVNPILANGTEGAPVTLRDGDEFRRTSRDDWYWYDLETKGWKKGMYRIWAILDNGIKFSVDITLR